MKYILNEKFILSEKFVLTEAKPVKPVKPEDRLDVNEGRIKSLLTNIITNLDMIINKVYTDGSENLLNDSIDSVISNVEEEAKEEKLDTNAFNRLKNFITELYNSRKNVSEIDKNVNLEALTDKNKVAGYLMIADKTSETVFNSVKSVNGNSIKNMLDIFDEESNNIKKINDNIIFAYQLVEENYQGEANKKGTTKEGGKRNWAKYITDAEARGSATAADAWKEYFAMLFENVFKIKNSEEFKGIFETLKIELKYYGFEYEGANANPFLIYLQKVDDQIRNIFKNGQEGADKYLVIHNAVAGKNDFNGAVVSLEELNGAEPKTLIYNVNLFKVNSILDMISYLDAIDTLRDWVEYKKINGPDMDKILFGEGTINYKTSALQNINNVNSAINRLGGGKTKQLLTDETSSTMVKNLYKRFGKDKLTQCLLVVLSTVAGKLEYKTYLEKINSTLQKAGQDSLEENTSKLDGITAEVLLETATDLGKYTIGSAQLTDLATQIISQFTGKSIEDLKSTTHTGQNNKESKATESSEV